MTVPPIPPAGKPKTAKFPATQTATAGGQAAALVIDGSGTIQRKAYPSRPNSVLSRGANAPPTVVDIGDTFIIGTAPTGAWLGRANHFATYTGEGWVFLAPSAGDTVVILVGAEAGFLARFGTVWITGSRYLLISSPGAKSQSVGSFFITTYSQSILVYTVASNTYAPQSQYFVSALLTSAPTGANLAGHYIQTSGTPTVGALNDVIYWSGTAATLEFTYANAGNVVGVGSTSSARLSYCKDGQGGWGKIALSAKAPTPFAIASYQSGATVSGSGTVPFTVNFNTFFSGSTLAITGAFSCWSTILSVTSFQIRLDGVLILTARMTFNSTGVHTYIPVDSVATNIAAGAHTLTVTFMGPQSADSADYINLVATEYPQ